MPRGKKKRNRSKRNNRRRGGGKNFVQDEMLDKLERSKIPKALMGGGPFPSEMVRNLTFTEPAQLFQSSMTDFLVKEWRMTDIWDPDPSIGGGTVAGSLSMLGIYLLWQVRKFKFRFNVVNNENTKPISFGFIMRDRQPSLDILTLADAQNALEVQPCTKIFTVGETSGMSKYQGRWQKVDCGHVLGNPIKFRGDIDYAGAGPATPSQVLWIAVVAYIGAGDLTNGFFMDAQFVFNTKFWSLKGLQESPSSFRDFYDQLVSEQQKSQEEAKKYVQSQKELSIKRWEKNRDDLRVKRERCGIPVKLPKKMYTEGCPYEHPYSVFGKDILVSC